MTEPESGAVGRAAAPRNYARSARRVVPPDGTSCGHSARSALYCDVSACRPAATLRLSGQLASDTIAELGAELGALIRTEHYHLVVDMNALSHISPICVGLLNRAAAELLPFGGQLILAGATDADFRALRRAGLDSRIQLASARRARDSAPSVATD